jgi:polyhydroxyalkanoate synthase subunit PhaC
MSKVYVQGYRLSSFYNSIYLDTFYETLKEGNKQLLEKIRTETTEGNNTFLIEMNLTIFDYLSSNYDRWLKSMDKKFDMVLRSDEFLSSLSEYVSSLVDLHSVYKQAGYPVDYMDWLFDNSVKQMMSLSSIAKRFDSTPHEVLYTRGKVRLLHYTPHYRNQNSKAKDNDDTHDSDKTKAELKIIPAQESKGDSEMSTLLIIYAPINRFHILDINEDKSIVGLLLRKGLDVYLLDWGYPDQDDDNLSINDYVNYIDEAIHLIQERRRAITTDKTTKDNGNKVSLLGYCWGGIFALIYCTLNNNNLRNLILMATPVDFSKDNTVLAKWSKAIDSDKLIKEFGHIDGQALDLGFIMRNPPRYSFDKYLKFFRKLDDKKFVDIFLSVEKWLYDTPLIPGNLYRQLISDCYRKNLLISNSMYIDGKQIDLRKVDVPLLTIIAEGDDLASPESSLAVNSYVSSRDKTDMKNPGGHVGLCISSSAHQKLWPDVTEWILSHQ